MISIRNAEKFFENRTEFALCREGIIQKAQEASENGIITDGKAREIFGGLSEQFFEVITTDPEHIRMGIEDLRRAAR